MSSVDDVGHASPPREMSGSQTTLSVVVQAAEVPEVVKKRIFKGPLGSYVLHHDRIAFNYQNARPTRTASQAYEERTGVCRDYAHLAISFCRCMNIPARYCTGYLSDIGTPPPWGVGDFAAWFEAYLGGRWHMFDPRNNVPRIGRVLMARGRDACDVAIATTFGPNTLEGFQVWTDEMKGYTP